MKFILFFILSISQAYAALQDEVRLKHVDIRDLESYSSSQEVQQMATELIRIFRLGQYRRKTLPNGVRYYPGGGYRITTPCSRRPNNTCFRVRVNRLHNVVYGIEVNGITPIVDGKYELSVQAMIAKGRRRFFYRFYKIIYNSGEHISLADIDIIRDIPIRNFNFNIRVGLADFKAVLEGRTVFEGQEIWIKKVFPLAVGALNNEGEHLILNSSGLIQGHRSLTPLFRNLFISRERLDKNHDGLNDQFERVEPGYFARMPFIGIRLSGQFGRDIRAIGGQTFKERAGIAFHRPMNGGYWRPTLHRGFKSHGCMRMQIKDLYELYQTLYFTRRGRINLDIFWHTDPEVDTPYPHDTTLGRAHHRVVYKIGDKQKIIKGRQIPGRSILFEGNDGIEQEVTFFRSVDQNRFLYKLIDEYELDALESVELPMIQENYQQNMTLEGFLMSEEAFLDWVYIGNPPIDN